MAMSQETKYISVATPPPIPPRPADGHKGLFGRVLVIGGHDAMIGAPVMAATAALRCGAGLVQIAMSKSTLLAALTITPELIGLALTPKNLSELRENAEKADAIAIGPGMGQSADAKERLMAMIELDKPLVIDADGLNILASGKRWPAKFKAKDVLTPHPGEMKRLGKLIGVTEIPTDDDGRIAVARKAASAFESVVALKGHRTVVTDGERVYINDTGDSSLSKAGAGDVLTGITAAMLALKLDPFDATCIAVNLHGKAGEMAGNKLGMRCVLARDVIDAISDALGENRHGTKNV
jgi:ADP-dependent NAD(P)H-hydrate dehydratase